MNKKIPFTPFMAAMIAMAPMQATADTFDHLFQNRTLRVDYVFSGDARHQQISLDELRVSDGWWGRRVNLDKLLLRGNGQIVMTDTLGRDTLYINSFSTLFQEWQTTEEAAHTRKSFENVFLLPMPKEAADVTVTLSDIHGKTTSRFTHRVNPLDILIRPVTPPQGTTWEYVRQGGDSRDCIDLAFVSEGYTEQEKDLFLEDCRQGVDAFLSHEPFRSMAGKLNFVAVFSPSAESGVSIPHNQQWKQTVLGSNFDTFYSERYLTTLHLKKLHDVLGGAPYEHIVILANTDNYGGGGIYNSYLMSAAHNAKARPVLVHEFGHSFGGLGDEYFYDDQYDTMYPSDTEPWEPNITTLLHFSEKWQDMLPAGTPIPTPADGKDIYTRLGVYEGAGYQSKGVYRPVQECRMKINEAPEFCPVCRRALERMIDYHTR